jgi:hypothetical protein
MKSATAIRVAEPLGGVPAALLACAGLLFHACSQAALPSSPEEAAKLTTEGVTHAPDDAAVDPGVVWSLPALRLGGSLAYSHRRDTVDGLNSMQSGLLTTVNASTSSFIWQPWFARVDAALGFTKVSSNGEGVLPANDSASAGVLVTGRGQLSVLAQSKFPFEAHFEKSDNKVDTNLAASSDAANQRYGFTQHYFRAQGESSLAWDRSTQTSSNFGSDQQESLELRSAHNLESHQLQFSSNRTVNRHDNSGESAAQNNLTAQHNYTPDTALSVLSMANLSSSELHLQQGDNTTQLAQFSSNAFWRATEQAISVNGGVRAITLAADQTGSIFGSDSTGTRLHNVNANAGINYDYSRFTRFNASVNVGSLQSSTLTSTQSSQSLGASYQPDSIALGAVAYNWAVSVNAFNRNSSDDSQSGLTLQLNHGLNRSFKLDGGSTVRLSGDQALLINTSRGNPAFAAGIPQPSQRQLTHSGSAAWDLLQQTGAALFRLSVSDSRALDADRAYFQLINFQASSNLPTSSYSGWTGSLTVQVVRQGRTAMERDVQADESNATSASGSLSYQTQRLFGGRNLRFGSDLRLNIQSQQSQRALLSQQSFLSQLESRSDQETAAWVNHLDYAIGRTQLRLQLMVSRTSGFRNHAGAGQGTFNQAVEASTNRSIYFTLIRRFGDY